MFVNLRTVPASADASLADVVKAGVFLVDIGYYAAVNEIYSGDLDNLSDDGEPNDGEPNEYLALSRTNPYRS